VSIPQAINDALGKLQNDADDLTLKTEDAAAKAQAAQEAAHAANVAQSEVSAATGQLGSDRDALVALIQQTYKTS
jgi:uncharacterized protein YdbL (DUF1318 family)